MTEFVVPIRPRYGEVDRMGVVYHAHYLVYFELGRTEFMRARGSAYADLEARGFQLVVLEANVAYHAPAHYDEALHVVVRLGEVRRASLTFEYELRRDGEGRLASGYTRLGCLGTDRRPTRLPDQLLAGLEPGRKRPERPSHGP